ncbi:MAG TPA: hypothetical protein VK436_02155 [Methanocella sp.]|nr:hypothetical protein [Methanocella sp.]
MDHVSPQRSIQVQAPDIGPSAYPPVPSMTTAPVISIGTSAAPAPSVIAAPAQLDAMAADPQKVSGQLVDYGTSRDSFRRGEKATGYMTIKNTGNTVINDVTASVSAGRSVPVIGSVRVGSMDYPFTGLDIQPGEIKRVEFSVDIPSEYKGVSTAGDYTLSVSVKTGDVAIGSFSRNLKVT